MKKRESTLLAHRTSQRTFVCWMTSEIFGLRLVLRPSTFNGDSFMTVWHLCNTPVKRWTGPLTDGVAGRSNTGESIWKLSRRLTATVRLFVIWQSACSAFTTRTMQLGRPLSNIWAEVITSYRNFTEVNRNKNLGVETNRATLSLISWSPRLYRNVSHRLIVN